MSKSSLDYWREREQEANRNAIRDEARYTSWESYILDAPALFLARGLIRPRSSSLRTVALLIPQALAS